MMSAAALMLSAVVAASPLAQPAADSERDPIRCRPAPYYVAHRSGQPPKRALQDAERRVRACYLVTLKKKPLRVLV